MIRKNTTNIEDVVGAILLDARKTGRFQDAPPAAHLAGEADRSWTGKRLAQAEFQK